MIRCSTLHDLQCLCHQKYCTIPGAYSNSSSFFTHRLRQSWHKNTRHERNCIPGMLNSVPFRTAALGTAQKKKCQAIQRNGAFQGRCFFVNKSVSTFIGTKERVHIIKIAVAHSPRSGLVEPRSRCQPNILHKLTATV